MMKTLDVLFRINKLEINKLQREVVNVENRIESLVNYLKELENELSREIHCAHETADYSFLTLSSYLSVNCKKQEEIHDEVKKLSKSISLLKEQMLDVFSSSKKHEVLARRYKELRIKVLEKKEQELLDEIGVRQNFRNF